MDIDACRSGNIYISKGGPIQDIHTYTFIYNVNIRILSPVACRVRVAGGGRAARASRTAVAPKGNCGHAIGIYGYDIYAVKYEGCAQIMIIYTRHE